MALVDNSLICWRMAGWEKISPALSQLMTISSIAGMSQLALEVAVVFTSSKTSPGAAKTFINRPASDVAGTGGAADGGAGVGGMESMVLIRSYPLLRQKPAKVTRNVGIFLTGQCCETDFPELMGRAKSPWAVAADVSPH